MVDNDFIQKCLMQDISFFQNKKLDDVYIESSRVVNPESKTEVSQTNTLKKD